MRPPRLGDERDVGQRECLADKIAEFLNSVSIEDLSREALAMKAGQPPVDSTLCSVIDH